jgi:YHS domain-containing protein
MNALPEANSRHPILYAKSVFCRRYKSSVRLALVRGLLPCALSAAASYLGHANPVNDPANGAKIDQWSAQAWIEKGSHKLNLDSHGVILKGYDPVAYFTQNKAVKGTAKYTANYQGATYYFSSSANRATFNRNPAKYTPQYGGFCANGMKNRQANDVDPTVFFILKGKLYVCSSPEAEKEFRSNEQQNIKKADQNWEDEDRWWY